MASIWLQYGFNMASIWLQYGFYMASIWLLYGFNLANFKKHQDRKLDLSITEQAVAKAIY